MEELLKYHDDITEEIDGAKHYAKMAMCVKHEHPDYAKTLQDMAMQELDHANNLHRISMGMLTEETRSLYDHMHKKDLEHIAEVKAMITMI